MRGEGQGVRGKGLVNGVEGLYLRLIDICITQF